MSLAIPPHVTAEQRKASDPETSAWVSANAGSGKTHVLAQRVLRLLLDGVPPAKILCLTFTKAAAANMSDRVFKKLSDWTALDDSALAEAIVDIGAPKPTPETLVFARRLFARTVETPGGLKIHTIHGFCERLLHLFPFEANVPARFEVMDDLGEAELLSAARHDALAGAQGDSGVLRQALQLLAAETSTEDFESLLREATQHRALLRHYTWQDAAADLGCALALPEDATVAAIEAEMIESGPGPRRWREFADFLGTGSKTDNDRAALFRQAADAHKRGAAQDCLALYLEIFFTAAGTGKPRDTLATAKLAKAQPGFADALREEQERLDGLRAHRKAALCLEKSLALTAIVAEIFARYEALKAARGKLDFDDLIDRTLGLFQRSDARWVLYKLNSGIDHILVDEAQDTSPAQWRILKALASEFFAGAGSRPQRRTFFAVGDEKQSIFSFQGAAPHMFHAMRVYFESAFTKGAQNFAHVQLKTSFRSVPAVLDAVDRVFGTAAHQRGLVTEDIWMGHEALKRTLPGLIEIWEPVAPQPQAEPGDWRLPVDLLDETDPANVLAGRIAKKISSLIADPDEYVFDADSRTFRRIAAGDILILVRTRNAFFDAVIRALKQHRVPVAGADRLDLLAHIAVMDLIAAGHAALLPQDDLTLASVLKSPLVGLDDDDLLAIAPPRKGSLFEALGASDEARHRAAYATLARWRHRAAATPFDFYARLLSEDGGRRAMEARLGPEACDAMDEFLRLTLRAEKDGTRSLAGFLAEIENLDLSIKRDMESGADAVRVMTIHAAKGLEAKIVFLPDTCSAPSGRHDSKIHVLNGRGTAKVLAWSPRKDDDPEAVALARQAAREEAENEHRRLFYVAMTRAEERLYVSGFHGRTEPNELCWGEMIAATRGDAFTEAPAFWDKDAKVLRYLSDGTAEKLLAAQAEARAAATITLPAYLTRPAPHEPAPLPPLRPSNALAAAEAEEGETFAAPGREARERGRLMHVLLQYLPEVARESRRQAAHAFLAARAGAFDAAWRENLVEEACALFDMPELAGLFGPQARAEVAVAGQVTLPDGRSRPVSGQIDRIAESEAEVLIADYKTGQPREAEATPRAYVVQMALYRALLAPLWPGKRLRMLLIWTAGPKVTELTEAQLTAALADIGKEAARASA